MAYVLGFFAADGSMYCTRRKTYFIEFQITDKDLLLQIQILLGSNHKITERPPRRSHQKPIFRLQIGCKKIFYDLAKLGFTQNKSKTVGLPPVPNKYFRDFLRGYFDGDGNVMFGYYRKEERKYLSKFFATRFTSGSRLILDDIKKRLNSIGTNGSLHFASGAWRLSYGAHDSEKLFQYMYHAGNAEGLIYLERKYKIFVGARNAVVAQFG